MALSWDNRSVLPLEMLSDRPLALELVPVWDRPLVRWLDLQLVMNTRKQAARNPGRDSRWSASTRSE
jgi:hypothetical protein